MVILWLLLPLGCSSPNNASTDYNASNDPLNEALKGSKFCNPKINNCFSETYVDRGGSQVTGIELVCIGIDCHESPPESRSYHHNEKKVVMAFLKTFDSGEYKWTINSKLLLDQTLAHILEKNSISKPSHIEEFTIYSHADFENVARELGDNVSGLSCPAHERRTNKCLRQLRRDATVEPLKESLHKIFGTPFDEDKIHIGRDFDDFRKMDEEIFDNTLIQKIGAANAFRNACLEIQKDNCDKADIKIAFSIETHKDKLRKIFEAYRNVIIVVKFK
jgi:hypothetical protein